jgi:hypothetical protein
MKLTERLSLVLLVLAGLILSGAAQSQEARGPPCADRALVIEQLRGLYGERSIGRGLADEGVLFELYASTSGTWTLFITSPQGKSCFVASGEAWEPVPGPDIFARR